ncbi:hypothetical protein BD626DRAFT_516652 [Schizophyllum amplum]|uniref:Uncharacterized protein n=1 Tax=Schizophyllum amplum TaxID=97359 RepID=A0A550BWT4_9AGAR|nr:hypothetical protein BD626DRAFT_516652 [Auriculariopsis ampla]
MPFYNGSPYSFKVETILTLKRLPATHVDVSPILPRPEISELLGIGYRRIPILAIGRDIYCDTSLIATVLERRFPASAGYGTIFPKRANGGRADTGLIKAFSKFYTDGTLSACVIPLIPWDKFPAEFIADRSKMLGGPIDPSKFKAIRGRSLSALSSHLALVEEQLSDGRFGDVSVYFALKWVQRYPDAIDELFNEGKFAKTMKWLDDLTAHLESLKADGPKTATIYGKEAADRIAAASVEEQAPPFDEWTAGLLGVKRNDVVTIRPEDNARDYPTKGSLVGLSDEEFVLEVKGESGSFLCHFPRMKYTVEAYNG